MIISGDDVNYTSQQLIDNQLIERIPTQDTNDYLPTANSLIISYSGSDSYDFPPFKLDIANNSNFSITLNNNTGITFITSTPATDIILPNSTNTYLFYRFGPGIIHIYSIKNSPLGSLDFNKILIGNSSNISSEQSISGDVTIDNNGVSVVTKINGNDLGNTSIVSGNMLIASGTNWVSKSVSGDVVLDSSGSMILDSSGVTAGDYISSDITVNSKGIITAASNGTVNFPLTDDYIFIGNGLNTATGYAISGDIDITNSGVSTVTAINGAPLGLDITPNNIYKSLIADGTSWNSTLITSSTFDLLANNIQLDLTLQDSGILGPVDPPLFCGLSNVTVDTYGRITAKSVVTNPFWTYDFYTSVDTGRVYAANDIVGGVIKRQILLPISGSFADTLPIQSNMIAAIPESYRTTGDVSIECTFINSSGLSTIELINPSYSTGNAYVGYYRNFTQVSGTTINCYIGDPSGGLADDIVQSINFYASSLVTAVRSGTNVQQTPTNQSFSVLANQSVVRQDITYTANASNITINYINTGAVQILTSTNNIYVVFKSGAVTANTIYTAMTGNSSF
jgi:membrane-bound inhibitor of C-type lysozyme